MIKSIRKHIRNTFKNDKEVEASISSIEKKLSSLNKKMDSCNKMLKESIWSDVYRDTVHDSSWFTKRDISPGRWAVGYPTLYVLYRVLDEFKPRQILELGLGQSTKMISQYASFHEGVSHFVVEHDDSWIEFMSNSNMLPDNTKIVKLERTMCKYKDAENIRAFKGFKEKFEDCKFDLIIIDAPLGGDMPIYSRIDVLGILPGSLNDDFCIIMDDYNRSGEKNTGKEISSILNANNIEYRTGEYAGEKDTGIWVSDNMQYFTSM